MDVSNYINDCQRRELDGSILTFYANETKWSYAKTDEHGLVVEVREKEVISEFATVGLYYFSRGRDFVNSAVKMIANNDRVNNEFYTCPVYNYAISAGLKIGVYNIDKNAMYGLGTPEDLENFKLNV
jgi:dTDP-glucose pyrophosphorylase